MCNFLFMGWDQLIIIQVGVYLGLWRCFFIGLLIRFNKWLEIGVKLYNSKENIVVVVDVKDKLLIIIINFLLKVEN